MAQDYWGHSLLNRLEEKVTPGMTALVIVDMQNDFLHPNGHCGASFGPTMVTAFMRIVAPIQRLATAARAVGVPVVYSKVTQLPDGSLASPVWLADNLRYGFEPRHCMRDTWGWEIVDELAPQPGDLVVEKTRRSVFQGSVLSNLLQGRGIRTLVVTGVAGSGCVESTVRDAIERDYFAIVPGDAIADASPDLDEHCRQVFPRILAPEDYTTTDNLVQCWMGTS